MNRVYRLVGLLACVVALEANLLPAVAAATSEQEPEESEEIATDEELLPATDTSSEDVRAEPPGTVFLTDDFEDSGPRTLPETAQATYSDGEFVFQVTGQSSPQVNVPGVLAGTTVAVDVRVPSGGRFPNVNCRQRVGGQYRLFISPRQGYFRISRRVGTQFETLLEEPSNAIRGPTDSNHLELTCAGNVISARINGTAVGQVEDDSYSEGQIAIGVGGPAGSGVVRFDNLVVVAADPAPNPGTILLADDFSEPSLGSMSSGSSGPHETGYANGEYFIRQLSSQSAPTRRLPVSFADGSIRAGVRVAPGNAAHLMCREQPGFIGGYWFVINAATGEFILRRFPAVAGGSSDDIARASSSAIRRGTATNNLELECIGRTISAYVNGTRVASVQDGAFQEGRAWLGAGFGGSSAQIPTEAHFDNLVVTLR